MKQYWTFRAFSGFAAPSKKNFYDVFCGSFDFIINLHRAKTSEVMTWGAQRVYITQEGECEGRLQVIKGAGNVRL
jgi:hypothetical protein